MGKKGDRLEVLCGWAGINNGGRSRVVMFKAIIVCTRLSIWAH